MRQDRLDRLRTIVGARRHERARVGVSTGIGAILLLLAIGVGMTWQPLRPAPASWQTAPAGSRPLPGPTPTAPVDEVDGVARFVWDAHGRTGAWVVRVLDAEFGELARLGPTGPGANSLPLPPELGLDFTPGVLYHWVVEAEVDGAAVRSRVAPFWLPAR